MRMRIFAMGTTLALAAALLVDHGDQLGLALTHSALLGLALGSVLGLVPGASTGGRIAGFLTGFVAAWMGYAARAGYLPDIPMGRAIAAFAVVAIVTAVAAVSAGRVPLWSGLIGVGALVGAYETAFATAPTAFTTESVTAATTVALATAIGFLATTLLSVLQPVSADAALSDDAQLAIEPRTVRLPGQRVVSDVPTTTEASL